ETVDAFEMGLKGSLLDGRMQFSMDVYHQTHDDYQTAAFIGTIFSVSNAEKATTQGIEFDTQLVLTDAWRLSASAAITDAKFNEFKNAPCNALLTPDANGNCDQSGYRLPFVAKWNFNIGTEYEIPVPVGYVTLRADLAVSDDYNPD